MLFLRGKKQKRMLVIGLDGVPFGLLKRLADTGVMPHTAQVLKTGNFRPMRASLPPISSVSWSCFMTGANPAEHGIFGFTDVDPQSYQLKFPLFSDLAAPTIWDRLGNKKLRCAVINQPATYPARKFPGVLVSGFVALEMANSVWPRQHLAALKQIDYRIDIDSQNAKDDPDGLLDDLEATLKTRRMLTAYLWEVEPWDYFQIVVTGTDRLHHFLWNAVEDAGDPRHDRAMNYYRTIDEFIGKLWERFHKSYAADNEGEGVVLLSDHGFTRLRKDVRLNAWLKECDYLTYQSKTPKSIAEIAEGSRAFALDPGRIYLNTRGRFGRGCVEPQEAAALRDEIALRLRDLTYEGETVIAHLFNREEAFCGPLQELAPDLVAVSHDGFDLKGTTKENEIFGDTHFQGMHTWEDAFVWSMLPVAEHPNISDLAAIMEDWLIG